jgi:hypothetical protein
MASSVSLMSLLAYLILPIEMDLMADGNSHNQILKSQALKSVTSSRL